MNSKHIVGMFALVGSVSALAAVNEVNLKGYVADRMRACYANHVAATDPMYYAREFRYPAEPGAWQTEFWGKYMLSAVEFAERFDDAALKARIARSVKEVCSNQEADGYIGNYPKDKRAGSGWDLWGNKYTMRGLVEWYEFTGDEEALVIAARLADYVMGIFGPGKRHLNETGCWRGLPSCSMLEVIVKLYKITGAKRYLDFASYIVSELDEGERSPRLLRDAGVDPAERVSPKKGQSIWTLSSRKSYEMMSCYQGLIAYAAATGRKDIADACVKTAERILATEINITGGASSHENWYGGREKQTSTYRYENETCVVTTWMRFCEEILKLTNDPKWADEIERSFYNAYLASQRPDGSEFVQYTSLCGRRHFGENHSRLHTNCCTANGPRGYLAYIRSLIMADKDAVTLNFYASGDASVVWPKTGERISLETYTLYPKVNSVSIRYRERSPKSFKLRLRIPGWSAKTSVQLNRKPVEGVKAGEYLVLDREWKCGDQIDLGFDFSPRATFLNDKVAFTMGPLVLSRDRRFGDGDLGEVISLMAAYGLKAGQVPVRATRTTNDAMYYTAVGLLTTGVHTKNAGERYPSVINFCDYASAGNTWGDDSYFRVWLDVEHENEEL